jgi:hypothetical protein
LAEEGKIKRNTQTLPYYYYLSHNADPLGRIAINWARLWLMRSCASWERVSMDYSISTCTILNTVTGQSRQVKMAVDDDTVKNIKEVLLCQRRMHQA